MNVITSGKSLGCLEYLLEFLAAWEKRPVELTHMAYQWCSAISEEAGRLGFRGRVTDFFELSRRQYQEYIRHCNRQGLQDLHPFEGGFSEVGLNCDSICLGGASHHNWWGPLGENGTLYLTLEIAFRLAVPDHGQPDLSLSHTPHCDWVFETAFSSYDDDVIADAVCAWAVDAHHIPTKSFVDYLAKRVESCQPFSPRLRQLSMHVIKHIWPRELLVSELETVRLLNYLKVDVDDIVKKDNMMGVGGMREKDEWVGLLLHVIYSPVGRESLSSHYWHLLDKLCFGSGIVQLQHWRKSSLQNDVTTSLEKAQDWEKLETWMAVSWQLLQSNDPLKEETKQATHRLLSQQPLALPRFEDLCESETIWFEETDQLWKICMQVRIDQSSLGSHGQ